ncbi:MAG: 1-acyl-sn-glycerol-3-phosphate acyltransferase [Gemmatimonadaceae bacterium]
MTRTAALVLAALALGGALAWRLTNRWLDRVAARTVHNFGARIDRFKLTRKRVVIALLLRDQAIAAAARAHASEHGEAEAVTWRRVRAYLDEIIPFFNILAYYRVGYAVSRSLLNLFYKVSVHYEKPDPFRGLPKDAIVIYLLNHRSNADYVLVAYALAGNVAISYAVGEWARAFPLEYVFKAFGSYFIRRRFRQPLYHAVLERYVQLITRQGITQGIFPEGSLTRDGSLRPAKIGLLDYMLGIARDPQCRARMFIVPVAVNYDRVLEDRTLLGELAGQRPAKRLSKVTQFGEVARYAWWNALRLVTRRWIRYGEAAVVIGTPLPVTRWLDEFEAAGLRPFELERHQRLAHVQRYADDVMRKIGELMPVTPVALACAALRSFASDFVAHDKVLERMEHLRDALPQHNTRVLGRDCEIAESFERAYRMLRMRRIVTAVNDGYLILPKGRSLIAYYANSVAHLLPNYVPDRQAEPPVAPWGAPTILGPYRDSPE